MSGRCDSATPAWILDVAEEALRAGESQLIKQMLARDENVADNLLWSHRKSQFYALLATVMAPHSRAAAMVIIEGAS